MGLYAERIAPRMIDRAMRNEMLLPIRQRVVSGAAGRVLEIGIGSGINLPLYGPGVSEVMGLDPSALLLQRARDKASTTAFPVHLLNGSAEHIPIETGRIDCIVMTFVACSIPRIDAAFSEMRRVLKPNGKLLFVEHGRAPEAQVALWQDRVTPLWRRFQGGCHLNRQMDDLMVDAGFRIDHLETGFFPGPKILSYVYEGAAIAA